MVCAFQWPGGAGFGQKIKFQAAASVKIYVIKARTLSCVSEFSQFWSATLLARGEINWISFIRRYLTIAHNSYLQLNPRSEKYFNKTKDACEQSEQTSDQMGTRSPTKYESVLCSREGSHHVDSPVILAESIAQESNSHHYWDKITIDKTLQAAFEQLP